MVSIACVVACCVVGGVEPPAGASAARPITFESLLAEMIDREALARFPDPAYTCKQFSSYDRASKTPDDAATWFANGDSNHYLRTEKHGGRSEWMMADMDGPGAVVRVWSADPKGTMRVYLDREEKPVIEGAMGDLLRGKGVVGAPLSEESARGCNLYLPIPYAKHCTITSDRDGFYYQVNYRTYAGGAIVKSFASADLGSPAVQQTQSALVAPREKVHFEQRIFTVFPGASEVIFVGDKPAQIRSLVLTAMADFPNKDLRSVVIAGTFDGEQTIWCPLTDFFGCGVSPVTFQDWYRTAQAGSRAEFRSDWAMPFLKSAEIKIINLGTGSIRLTCGWDIRSLPKDVPSDRLMHFHANWRAQYPIHAFGGKGTMDWNYITATGKGVYVGDSLAVMNPVEAWWGEGDEKIYVDGESFPSHFGTGTEDYYGFAWCDPHVFQHPFHAQPRVDGNGKDNWGHTTVTRVRSLDAIPFTKSLRFDMEVWHWAECDVAYAATTYWYALPGATCNIAPDPEQAKREIPQPPARPKPMTIAGAIECEGMTIAAKSKGLEVEPQGMNGFAKKTWSGDSHLWVKGRKAGDFVELVVKPADAGAEKIGMQRLTVYATRSWDYGIVRFTVNGQAAGPDGGAAIDLFSGEHKVAATGPIVLGAFAPRADGTFLLRAEVTGGNPKGEGSRAFFGLDCVVVEAAGR